MERAGNETMFTRLHCSGVAPFGQFSKPWSQTRITCSELVCGSDPVTVKQCMCIVPTHYFSVHMIYCLTVIRNIGRECIECVIIAPPDVSDDLTLRNITETWRELETAVDDGLVSHLGIADVSNRLFKELYEWARVRT